MDAGIRQGQIQHTGLGRVRKRRIPGGHGIGHVRYRRGRHTQQGQSPGFVRGDVHIRKGVCHAIQCDGQRFDRFHSFVGDGELYGQFQSRQHIFMGERGGDDQGVPVLGNSIGHDSRGARCAMNCLQQGGMDATGSRIDDRVERFYRGIRHKRFQQQPAGCGERAVRCPDKLPAHDPVTTRAIRRVVRVHIRFRPDDGEVLDILCAPCEPGMPDGTHVTGHRQAERGIRAAVRVDCGEPE